MAESAVRQQRPGVSDQGPADCVHVLQVLPHGPPPEDGERQPTLRAVYQA